MKNILVVIIIACGVYFAIAFGNMQINCFLWQESERKFLVCGTFFISYVFIVIKKLRGIKF